MRTETLERIGLTKSEVKVYLALLELGSSTTGKIVDKSKASSSKIYEILDRLIQKGLVSFIIKSGVKYFEAAPPERIMDYMNEKEKAINEQKQELKTLLPELELKRQLSKYKSEATIFKGIKGAKTAFDDILNSLNRGEKLSIMGIFDFDEDFTRFITRFHKQRSKKGIKANILLNYGATEIGKELANLPNTKIKYMQKDVVTPAVFLIYKNKTLISLPNQRTFFRIDNKEAAESFKSYFDVLWSQKVTIFRGIKQTTSFFDNMLATELKKGDEYSIINANWGLGNVPDVVDYFNNFHKKRQAKGVRVTFLFNSSLGKEGVKGFALEPCKYKFLPSDFKSPLQVAMFKDKVYMSIWSKDAVGFLIEGKQVVDAFKSYFDVLWKQDTRIVKGLDAIQEIFEDMLDAGSCDFIGARGYFMDARPRYIDDWEKRAIEKGFTYRNIVNIEQKGHRNTKFSFAQTRYTIPKEFSRLSVFWIYGNKVVISNWVEKEPIAVIIENKALHDMYEQQFEVLWNRKVKF